MTHVPDGWKITLITHVPDGWRYRKIGKIGRPSYIRLLDEDYNILREKYDTSSVSSLIRERLRFSVSKKMDFNFPHGPQKIEILKKVDLLHVKSHEKNFTSKG